MDREFYLRQVEAVWASNRPRTIRLHFVPWPWSGQAVAREVASRLATVVEELSKLEPPEGDRDKIDRHYLRPLRSASAAATDLAERTPRGARSVSTVVAIDEVLALYSDDDHDFLVDYGLAQWWTPSTEAWGPRRHRD